MPDNNVKGYPLGRIGDVVSDVHYGTSAKASDNGKYVYIRMNNITYEGALDLSDIKRIDVADSEIENYIVRYGDVLFNRTNSRDLVGKTCVFDRKNPMIIAGYIIRLRMNGLVLPEYLSLFMNTRYAKKLLLIFIPLVSVFYTIFREFVYLRLKKQHIKRVTRTDVEEYAEEEIASSFIVPNEK